MGVPDFVGSGRSRFVEGTSVGEFAFAVAAGLVTTAIVKLIEFSWKFGKRGSLMFPCIAKAKLA